MIHKHLEAAFERARKLGWTVSDIDCPCGMYAVRHPLLYIDTEDREAFVCPLSWARMATRSDWPQVSGN